MCRVSCGNNEERQRRSVSRGPFPTLQRAVTYTRFGDQVSFPRPRPVTRAHGSVPLLAAFVAGVATVLWCVLFLLIGG